MTAVTTVETVRDHGAVVVLDGRDGIGQVVTQRAVEVGPRLLRRIDGEEDPRAVRRQSCTASPASSSAVISRSRSSSRGSPFGAVGSSCGISSASAASRSTSS